MKTFGWNHDKNQRLKTERGICFEDVIFHLEQGDLLDILDHPNPKRYPGQRMFVIAINDYAVLVPFVEDDHEVFLKTIMPSRKATKLYLKGQSDEST